ncbi:MAG: hypothetical protein D4R88_03230 [Methanosarcinales archaeon]|nr:MAG: hypothetical protein D4R88_03230 [Methanosarcinales archaeon]
MTKNATLQRRRVTITKQLFEEICKKAGINEKELRMGGRRRKVSKTRAEISYRLNCELGIPAAEIARHLGLCTSAIAKSIEKYESSQK